MTLNMNRDTWRSVRLGDVVANVNDFYDPVRDGILPYVAGPHIDSGAALVTRWGSTDDDVFPPTFKRIFHPGDVLLHSRGPEKVASVDRRGVTGEKLFVLRALDEEIVCQAFIVWLLRSDTAQKYFARSSSGSVNKFLNWTAFVKFEFMLPPLDQQKRIADLLWSIESAIQSAQQVRSALVDVADLRGDELLTPGPGTVMKTCKELCSSITVGIVIRPTQYYAATGAPAIRSLNVTRGGFVLDDLVYFDLDSHASLTKTTLRLGDVVVVRTGRPGDAAVVDESTAGNNCIDLIIARPGENLVPNYLARYLNSRTGRAATLRTSAGTAQQHFNVSALAQLVVPARTVSEQMVIVDQLKDLDSAIGVSDSEIDAGKSLREAMSNEFWGNA